jgi:hypothetical protein
LYKVLIRPAVTYALESEEAVGLFEGRILRCTLGQYRTVVNGEI